MTGPRFERLVRIMRDLRGPEGCPWDRQQDLRSLQPMLIEELYEVVEAVDTEDYPGLAEELGDLLLHIVFHAELGRETGAFDIDTVLDGICEKLVRRHPHVFGDEAAGDADQALANWEAIKRREKQDSGAPPAVNASLLDGIPSRLPALSEAHKISERVARQGFDWPDLAGVLGKLEEETRELSEAASIEDEATRRDAAEAEIGDMLFVVVNIARHLGLDSEAALKRSNRKFRERFRHIETVLGRSGRTPADAAPGELESLWQQAKALPAKTFDDIRR
jgi:MazG family protein